MAPTNTTTSTWAQVGDFMIRSDGTTVQPVELSDEKTAWTITSPDGTQLHKGECVFACTSPDSAMLIADAL